jgi:hypothetical protein
MGISYEVNEHIPVPDIYEPQRGPRRGDKTHHIPTGIYDVFIERIGRQGDNMILVAHAVNDAILAAGGQDPLTDDFKRVEAFITARLMITLADGEVLFIDGSARSRQTGTDIRFNLADVAERIEGLPNENFVVVIDAITYALGGLTIPLNVDELNFF